MFYNFLCSLSTITVVDCQDSFFSSDRVSTLTTHRRLTQRRAKIAVLDLFKTKPSVLDEQASIYRVPTHKSLLVHKLLQVLFLLRRKIRPFVFFAWL